MFSRNEFDTAEEVEAATALYGQLLCSPIRRLAAQSVLDRSDMTALAEAVERFVKENEHLPAVVDRHASALADFLRTLPAGESA